MLLGSLLVAVCWDAEMRWKVEEEPGKAFLWDERRGLGGRIIPVLSYQENQSLEGFCTEHICFAMLGEML